MVATQIVLEFSPRNLGKISNLTEFFSNGLVQPPTSFFLARFAFLTVDPLRGVGKGFSLTLCFSIPQAVIEFLLKKPWRSGDYSVSSNHFILVMNVICRM